MDNSIEQILAQARLAPSGDNTQPVRFSVDHSSRTISLVLDPTRDPSPMNAGQRMARMALGASLENLLQTAEALGLDVEVESGRDDVMTIVRVTGSESGPTAKLEFLSSRVTNRRLYDGRPIPSEILERLDSNSPPVGSVTTHWIVGRERIDPLASLIGEADAAMFGDPSMRRAFLAKVRFDEPPGASVEEGLSIGSLEIGLADRLALQILGRLPDRLVKLAGGPQTFAKKARQLAGSASGFCLVVAPDGEASTDIVVGRVLQKAWLGLASEGLATQPMMSLLVLENVNDHGEPGLIEALGRAKLESLRERFRQIGPEIKGRRPAWLLRFGYSLPPSGRTGRLPVESLLVGPRG